MAARSRYLAALSSPSSSDSPAVDQPSPRPAAMAKPVTILSPAPPIRSSARGGSRTMDFSGFATNGARSPNPLGTSHDSITSPNAQSPQSRKQWDPKRDIPDGSVATRASMFGEVSRRPSQTSLASHGSPVVASIDYGDATRESSPEKQQEGKENSPSRPAFHFDDETEAQPSDSIKLSSRTSTASSKEEDTTNSEALPPESVDPPIEPVDQISSLSSPPRLNVRSWESNASATSSQQSMSPAARRRQARAREAASSATEGNPGWDPFGGGIHLEHSGDLIAVGSAITDTSEAPSANNDATEPPLVLYGDGADDDSSQSSVDSASYSLSPKNKKIEEQKYNTIGDGVSVSSNSKPKKGGIFKKFRRNGSSNSSVGTAKSSKKKSTKKSSNLDPSKMKPGESYNSTPHSAEIVVRTKIEPSVSSSTKKKKKFSTLKKSQKSIRKEISSKEGSTMPEDPVSSIAPPSLLADSEQEGRFEAQFDELVPDGFTNESFAPSSMQVSHEMADDSSVGQNDEINGYNDHATDLMVSDQTASQYSVSENMASAPAKIETHVTPQVDVMMEGEDDKELSPKFTAVGEQEVHNSSITPGQTSNVNEMGTSPVVGDFTPPDEDFGFAAAFPATTALDTDDQEDSVMLTPADVKKDDRAVLLSDDPLTDPDPPLDNVDLLPSSSDEEDEAPTDVRMTRKKVVDQGLLPPKKNSLQIGPSDEDDEYRYESSPGEIPMSKGRSNDVYDLNKVPTDEQKASYEAPLSNCKLPSSFSSESSKSAQDIPSASSISRRAYQEGKMNRALARTGISKNDQKERIVEKERIMEEKNSKPENDTTPVSSPYRARYGRSGRSIRRAIAGETDSKPIENSVLSPPLLKTKAPEKAKPSSRSEEPKQGSLASKIEQKKTKMSASYASPSWRKSYAPKGGLPAEAQSDDPIERAGARLLHSAAIPIQKVIRGYLAKGEAMDRLWSIMLIQANIRRWLCQEAYEYTIFSATLIQAAFRGWRVRDQLDDQYYCATEIQRVFRGYLATMSVYEDLYNVTLIQSIVRMKLGMNEAARKRKTLRCSAATKIQSLWRKYVSQLSFQFDVVDIIIVQSIIRRRQVLSTFQQQQKAALVLQSTWRGFKCWADYVFTMADIVVSQRTVRQWLAVRRVNSQRKMMAAVVLIQSAFRRRLVEKRNEKLRNAAMNIQKTWRGYVHYSFYLYMQFEHQAAVTIQRHWRGFWENSHYVILYFNVLKLQACVRKVQAQKRYSLIQEAASLINALGRGYLGRQVAYETRLRNTLAKMTQGKQPSYSSSLILQRAIRGVGVRVAYKRLLAARKIQAAWRGFQNYTDFIFTISDIVIVQRTVRAWLAIRKVAAMRRQLVSDSYDVIIVQSVVRRHQAIKRFEDLLYADERGATKIQKTWRRYVCYSKYEYFKHEKNAATTIQCHWLGNRCMVSYEATKAAALCAQRWWRVVAQRRKEKAAGLRILSFFIMVKAEVDSELRRIERKMEAKRQKKLKKQKKEDEKLLEKIWLSVDGDDLEAEAIEKAKEAALTELKKFQKIKKDTTDSPAARARPRSRSRGKSLSRTPRANSSHRDQVSTDGYARPKSNISRVSVPTSSPRSRQMSNSRSGQYPTQSERRSVERHMASEHAHHSRSRSKSIDKRSGREPVARVSGDYGFVVKQHEEYHHPSSRSARQNGRYSESGAALSPDNTYVMSGSGPGGGHARREPTVRYGMSEQWHGDNSYGYTEGDESVTSGVSGSSAYNRTAHSRRAQLSGKDLYDDQSLEEAWMEAENQKQRIDGRHLDPHGVVSSSRR